MPSGDKPAALKLAVTMFFAWNVLSDCAAALRTNEFGIDERIPLTSSRLRGSPDPPLPYRARRAFSKLDFKHPLYIARQPGTERMLVVEQSERVLAFTNRADVASTERFCFIPDHEIYSLTFHPRYASNRFVYVFSNGPQSSSHKTNKIFRYVVSRDSLRCDDASRQLVIEWESNGHNGGDLAFGPDGMLYISSGDGTSDSDRNVTGQDITDLNSGMLRIDVDQPGVPYTIPKDNPFLTIPKARGELWAYGFRNPWRIHFDSEGNLWVGDIGQDLWEMIIIAQRGANYGWSVTEGGHPFRLQRQRGPTPFSTPVIELPHSEARSITGGLVYHGSRFPKLRGAYIFGDYGTGRIWAARYRNGVVESNDLIADTPHQILGFGADARDEMFYVDYAGAIYELESSPPSEETNAFPRRLSQTGLFASVKEHQPAAGLIPYSVNAPYWSDGAFMERFIALPGESQIDFNERETWKFPEETVLVQSLALELKRGNPKSRRWIETRVLLLEQNEWAAYSYRWNDEQTDAELLPASGDDREFELKSASGDAIPTLTWRYPSRTECLTCHSRQAGFALGMNVWQMNHEHDYGGVIANQLTSLEHIGALKVNLNDHVAVLQPRVSAALHEDGARFQPSEALVRDLARFTNAPRHRLTTSFTNLAPGDVENWWTNLVNDLRDRPQFTTRLAKSPGDYIRLANPYDASAGLTNRVRAYLHANCSHCHTEAGGGNSAMELPAKTRLADMRIIDVPPQHDAFGLSDARIIASGHPERSVMYWRLTHRGFGQMPPLSITTVDQRAARLFDEWIRSLDSNVN
jgi:glucose/arabinose dehydrogenase